MRGLLKYTFLFLITLFVFEPASGQENNTSGFPVFEATWSNDIFHQTDRNFTNGIDLAFYHPVFKKSPVRYIMLPHKDADITWQGLTLTQHFFTPRELFSTEIVSQDRPYASYLLLGHKKISANPNRFVKRTSEIQIGILGRKSGGEALQNGIHFVLPASGMAIGWDNQINTDLAVNYSMKYEKGILNKKSFNLVPYGETKIGVPYTWFGGGLRTQIGKMNNYFGNIHVSKSKDWELYAFGDIGGRYVAYNGVLEGGLINSSIHTINEIKPWVYNIKGGFVFAVKSFSIEYASILISKEYDGGGEHKWGYITLRFAF